MNDTKTIAPGFRLLSAVAADVNAASLGNGSDDHDVAAFREALARAWPFGEAVPLSPLEQTLLVGLVRDGKLGRDENGKGWRDLARVRRAAK